MRRLGVATAAVMTLLVTGMVAQVGGQGGTAVPEARLGYAPYPPAVGDIISFNDRSTGDIDTWRWEFGDGSVSAERHPDHRYAAAGVYMVTLEVCGEQTSCDAWTESLVVAETSSRPADRKASFEMSPAQPRVGQAVTLTDTSPPDGIASLWRVRGVSYSTAPSAPVHRFMFRRPGTYSIVHLNCWVSPSLVCDRVAQEVVVTAADGTVPAETPDADTPEAETPDGGSPGTGVPDAESPNTGSPNTGSPDADMPGGKSPGAEIPGTDTPDTEAPGTESPVTETAGPVENGGRTGVAPAEVAELGFHGSPTILQWVDTNAGETGYRVFVNSPALPELAGTRGDFPPNTTRVRFYETQANYFPICYAVAAVFAGGVVGPLSDQVCTDNAELSDPRPAENLQVSRDRGVVTVTWSGVVNAVSGYWVCFESPDDFQYFEVDRDEFLWESVDEDGTMTRGYHWVVRAPIEGPSTVTVSFEVINGSGPCGSSPAPEAEVPGAALPTDA